MPPKLVQNEGLVARVHRPRLRGPRRDGVQPRDRAEKKDDKEKRDDATDPRSSSASSATWTRWPSSWRAGCPRTAAGTRRSSSRARLRRVPRRALAANAPGVDGHRAERRDPDLARARDHRARADGLRRCRLGRPAAHDGGGRSAPRPLAHVPAGRATGGRLPRGQEFAPATTAFLTRGASMPAEERTAILAARQPRRAARGARRALRGRIGIQVFSRELLRDQRKIVGLYDTTITATDPFPTVSRTPARTHALGDQPAYDVGQPAAALGDRRRDRPRVHAPRTR